MILRHFEVKDVKNLKTYRYRNMTDMQILSMIDDWNKGDCSGRYSEFFSIVQGGEMVGEIFVSEYTPQSVTVSVYVFAPFRRKGYATFGVKEILKKIAELNKYKSTFFLVRKDNEAALSFFSKIGYDQKNEFVSSKGQSFYCLKKDLKN